MPSFASAAAELRDLSKKWNAGKRAFNDLFDVLPGRVHLKETPVDPYHQYVFNDCNEQWIKQEAKRRTADDRRAIRQARLTGVSKEELRSMRRRITGKRVTFERELTEHGGLLSGINDAKRPSDATKAKQYLILCLGEYIYTQPKEETWQPSQVQTS